MKRFWWIIISIAAVVLIGELFVIFCLPTKFTDEELLLQAHVAMHDERYDEAEESAQQLLAQSPGSLPALLIAGEACARGGRFEGALSYFQQVPNDGSKESDQARFFETLTHGELGQRAFHDGHASKAEHHLRLALIGQPDLLEANRTLAQLMCIEGRRWESVEPLAALVRNKSYSPEELFLLSDPWRNLEDLDSIDKFRRADREDTVPLVGKARYGLDHNERGKPERLLRKVLKDQPNLTEAHVWLGYALHDQDPMKFDEWRAALPADAEEHPLIWHVYGLWARHNNQPRAAIRCLWEVIKRNPDHRPANYQLSQLLSRHDEPECAEPFGQRAELLERLHTLIDHLWGVRKNQQGILQRLQLVRDAAEVTEELGHYLEASAFYTMIFSYDQRAQWARAEHERVLKQAESLVGNSLSDPAKNPAEQINLSSYPLPRWNAPSNTQQAPSDLADTTNVAFQDMAKTVGIDFSYFNGRQPDKAGIPIYQTIGSGIGVLDYDNDGWPDLYLAQGSRWPASGAEQTEYSDRLCRNLGNGRFEDVTIQSGLGDMGYSHGVAIGDFNNDGFDDVYLANLGQNRLYRNSGDGTFIDVTENAGLLRNDWTTSCAIVDLNQDSLPDIYAVNYVDPSKSDITKLCGSPLRSCPPNVFTAAQDRLYLNLGNGQFKDITDECGIVNPKGYGLGILIAKLKPMDPFSIFVANDTSANYLFQSLTEGTQPLPSFVDRALVAGVAFNNDGIAQACMGIAGGDADGNGSLDIFVTNFHNDANTLYLLEGDSFVDATREARLVDPSFNMLGFGTQFMDGELDGKLDLIVTNGDIDDFSHEGRQFKQPPRYCRNDGKARFTEIKPETLGPYFQQGYLGRALARLDWNRDGREDLVVTHLDQPVALLTNETSQVGHFLSVTLHGIDSDRDAFGTIVRATVGDQEFVHQLTAGNGYLACNQRQLVIGLGESDQVDQLKILWPAGTKQQFSDLSADAELLFIEGQDRPVHLPATN